MGVLNFRFGRQQDRTVLIRQDTHAADGKMRGLQRSFTDEEWALLMFLPVDAFWLAAATGDGLDRSATAMFGRLLDGAFTLPNQLLAILVGDVGSSGQAELLRIVSAEPAHARSARIQQTKAVLQKKLSPAQYRRFIGLVLVMAYQMAKAAGGGLDSRRKHALAAFAGGYEVDLQSALACTCSATSRT